MRIFNTTLSLDNIFFPAEKKIVLRLSRKIHLYTNGEVK